MLNKAISISIFLCLAPLCSCSYKQPDPISACSISTDFSDNELLSISKYDGKKMIVSGEVLGKGDSIGGLFLQFSCGSSRLPAVQCFFNKTYAADLSKLSKGQFVSIKGTCKGRTMGTVIFESCSMSQE